MIILLIAALFSYALNMRHPYETFDDDIKLSVVYYAYLKPDRWRAIVPGQMKDLVACGLADTAEIHVVLCGDRAQCTEASALVASILGVPRTASITLHHHNRHEYPGIKKMHDLARAQPDRMYAYFHSKGMYFYEGITGRLPLEKKLFDDVIGEWKKVRSIFAHNAGINKICAVTSDKGYCFFNFFWVRGTYLKDKCAPPILTSDRYYYERYISEACSDSPYECLQISCDPCILFYPHDAAEICRCNPGFCDVLSHSANAWKDKPATP